MTAIGPGNLPENNGQHVDTYSRDLSRPDVPETPFLEAAQKWLLHHSLRLVHGPGEVTYGADEVIVLVVVRDGRPYVKSFVEHYRSLGAKHLVFLDNGSTDGTVEALKGYERRHGLQHDAALQEVRALDEEVPGRAFRAGRWTLNVDVDELFVYRNGRRGLKSLPPWRPRGRPWASSDPDDRAASSRIQGSSRRRACAGSSCCRTGGIWHPCAPRPRSTLPGD
jgi:hypothetical protein